MVKKLIEMKKIVSLRQAKAMLSKLVKRAARGETIFIGLPDRTFAKLVSANPPIQPQKRIGALKGTLAVPDDFDAPLPDNIYEEFEGTE